jgi:hypothetical protein
MGITEDRVRLVVLESMLIGLRARQRAVDDFPLNRGMCVESRLLEVEIKALEDHEREVTQRMREGR